MGKLRIRFNKTGDIRFISHLDVMRCFSRAFARTSIPLKYTEGFNPKIKMRFSPPLSLGYESWCEVLDVELVDKYDMSHIEYELNEKLPAGLRVNDVSKPEIGIKSIYYSRYLLKFYGNDDFFNCFLNKSKELISRNSIMVTKSDKNGKTFDFDIRKLISSFDIIQYKNVLVSDITVETSNFASLNPKVFVEKVLSEISLLGEGWDAVRTQFIKSDFDIFL